MSSSHIPVNLRSEEDWLGQFTAENWLRTRLMATRARNESADYVTKWKASLWVTIIHLTKTLPRSSMRHHRRATTAHANAPRGAHGAPRTKLLVPLPEHTRPAVGQVQES